jgi:K+-sensing histidine kinase KdpD
VDTAPRAARGAASAGANRGSDRRCRQRARHRAQDRKRIFGAFQTGEPRAEARGSGSPNQRKSSGLGLAIVHWIVETHGGQVHVESEPGRGARFVGWLPRTAA